MVGDDPSNSTNWGGPFDAAVGAYFEGDNNGSTSNPATGVQGYAYSNGSGTGNLRSFEAQAASLSSSTTPLVQGFSDTDGGSSGAITEYDAYNVTPQTGGTIVHYVGLNIPNVAGTGTTDSFAIKTGTGPVKFGDTTQITATTFATLPVASSALEGTMRPVTDSTTNTWGATITGGGSDHVFAYCNGTAWTVMAK